MQVTEITVHAKYSFLKHYIIHHSKIYISGRVWSNGFFKGNMKKADTANKHCRIRHCKQIFRARDVFTVQIALDTLNGYYNYLCQAISFG